MDPVFAALRRDIERTQAALPAGLGKLADVAWNLAWSWLPDAIPTFREIDATRWEMFEHNPLKLLLQGPSPRLTQLALDSAYLARVEALEARLQEYLAQPPAPEGEQVRQKYGGRPVAYFCAEFGIHDSLPIYAGGLGILAGDHLKSASDLGIPLVGVGLRYRQGYFHQGLDQTGWQVEYYRDTEFGNLPTGLILGEDGKPITVEIPLRNRVVTVQLWGARVGKIPLILLDTYRDDNDPIDQWITGHLYGGDRDTRISQEMVLGIGGVRALRALGYDPAVFHMNEGHAAFLGLELIRECLDRGQTWEEAVNCARSQTVFTTHTPVAAGHDVFFQDHVNNFMSAYLAGFNEESFTVRRKPSGTATAAEAAAKSSATSNVTREKLMALGRKRPEDVYEDFGMTPLAIHTSRSINGVSQLHGAVARQMWQGMWPGKTVDETPISHVTNGIHVGTWMAPAMQVLLTKHLGADWLRYHNDPKVWEAVDLIPDAELWEAHQKLKRRLVEFVRDRVRGWRQMTNESEDYIRAADELLEPDALTFGFARRVATYKRLSLLLHDPDRALSLLNRPGQPVQFIISGKAHPGDSEAKRLVQFLFRVRHDPRVLKRATFLVDYNMAVGAEMTQGVDVWLNLPRRPLEASGTSGMKVIYNGGLNCSILDGWWAEGYNGKNGWAVGSAMDYADTNQQDTEDAESLYTTLENQIIPLYFERDAQGVPRKWVAMIKESFKSMGPVFTTDRMLRQYAAEIYAP